MEALLASARVQAYLPSRREAPGLFNERRRKLLRVIIVAEFCSDLQEQRPRLRRLGDRDENAGAATPVMLCSGAGPPLKL